MKIAQALGDSIDKTTAHDLPLVVIETAKNRILDLLGVALNGYKRHGAPKNLFNILTVYALAPKREWSSGVIVDS